MNQSNNSDIDFLNARITALESKLKTVEREVNTLKYEVRFKTGTPKLTLVEPEPKKKTEFQAADDADDDVYDLCKKSKYKDKNKTWLQIIETDERYMRFLFVKNFIPEKVHIYMIENYDLSGWLQPCHK